MTFMDQTNLRAVKFKVYFIRFCRGDTKSHMQWTGRHLGYTDRASDIHYIFTSEITQTEYHLITSHLVPTVIHHHGLLKAVTPYKTYNSTINSSQVFGRNMNRAFGVRSQKG